MEKSVNRILYIDPISGIAGDMFLAAAVDLGVDQNVLKNKLQALAFADFNIQFDTVRKNGIQALYTNIKILANKQLPDCNDNISARHLHDILEIINYSNAHTTFDNDYDTVLNDNTIAIATKIFTEIAKAEAKVHNTSIDKVHFHEVGALDSIIDIIGAAICIDLLQVDKIVCGHVPTGFGYVYCEHGKLPVPAPATLELLTDIPIKDLHIEAELTTPTGAAILKSVVDDYQSTIPAMTIKSIGYGAGKGDFEQPNVLRLIIGELNGTLEKLWQIETTIDDMQPELYQHIINNLMAVGAIDAFIIPNIMKKGRNGCLLQVLTSDNLLASVESTIFRETTSLGIRKWEFSRTTLNRELLTVKIEGYEVAVKIGYYNGKAINFAPEYEDCKAVASLTNKPLKIIYQKALNEVLQKYYVE